MTEPLVTVIMPSLNVKKYIKECMDSVVGQSLRELEILCIDAGSTDGTLEILKEYARSDKRIKLLHSPMKSYGKQINMGFDLAKGKYIGVVETDDYIAPHMYEKLYAIAEENRLDFVKADFMGFVKLHNGQRYFDIGKVWTDEELYGKVLSVEEYPKLYIRDVNIWKGLYNRNFLINYEIRLNETPGAAFQDIGFCHLLLAYAGRGMYIKDMLYFYRRDNEASSSSKPYGICFAYQEYKRLCSLPIKCENTKLFYHYLYIRMACVVIEEYEKLLVSGTKFTKEFYEAIRWFRAVLRQKIKEKEITEKEIDERTWEKLELLVKSEDEFAAEWNKDQRKTVKSEKELIKKIGTSQIVIFGCGYYGGRSILFFDKHHISIAAFCDNNPGLWERQFHGYDIYRPIELTTRYSDIKIMISSPKYEKAIRRQLVDMGISEDRILSFLRYFT